MPDSSELIKFRQGYSIDDVFNGSFSTTEADKEKISGLSENTFEEQLELCLC